MRSTAATQCSRPAFIDAHCHLLATAARTLSIDCSPAAVRRSPISRAAAEAASAAQHGEWLRAAGYDESQLAERRHPTRRDLDAAVPHHPVRLLHRSGHARRAEHGRTATRRHYDGHRGTARRRIDRFTDDGSPSGSALRDERARRPPLCRRFPYEALAPAVVETVAPVPRHWRHGDPRCDAHERKSGMGTLRAAAGRRPLSRSTSRSWKASITSARCQTRRGRTVAGDPRRMRRWRNLVFRMRACSAAT